MTAADARATDVRATDVRAADVDVRAADVVVLGAGGGVGSAALYHLARRGVHALGLDRFLPGHDRGSSHGETRIIRTAYFEHPDYVPLLRRSYELWAELAARTGERLYEEVGLLQVGPPAGEVVPGVLASARIHGLDVEPLDATDVERRYPGFRVPAGMSAVLERRAGYLHVEACVRAHAREAVALGAELRAGVAVLGWRPEGDGVVVETDRGPLRARRLVVAPGAWAPGLLAELGVPLQVVRKAVLWFEAPADPYARCPAYLFETPLGVFYGFPRTARGLKVAEHSGGRPVGDPAAVDRALDPQDEARLRDFLGAHLPLVSGPRVGHAVCLYTLSPDHHFLLDRHPACPAVAFAAGLSGHGFKMTSVLGEALADLALDGATRLPVGFLGLARFKA